MKNLFLPSLFCCFFLLGTMSVANAQYGPNAVIVVDCHFKTGVVYSFEIPGKYLDKGELNQPLEIKLITSGKVSVYSTQSMSLDIEIPQNLTGDYILSIRIGKYYVAQEISL